MWFSSENYKFIRGNGGSSYIYPPFVNAMYGVGQSKFFSKLRNFKIYDSENEHIGRVGDMLLRKEDLSVYALISHDSVFKEKLESLRILNDRDEIIPLHHIDRNIQLPNQIRTTVKKKKLRTTSTNWETPKDYYMFSKLCQANVIDGDGDSIGRVTDIIYHEDNSMSLVIDPATYFQHIMESLSLRNHHDVVVPGDFVDSIDEQEIKLGVDRQSLEKIDALPIHMILQKSRENESLRQQSETIKHRYHYLVLQAPTYVVRESLANKGKKLESVQSITDLRPFDVSNDEHVAIFRDLFNDIALTSVDPYEQLDDEKIKEHFGSGTYLAYYLKQPVGYCITTEKENERMGAIAGIGIHHKHRGKRLSTAVMATMVDIFEEKGLEYVQADVLANNKASLGLFYGLGFKDIDDFYLT